MTDSLHNQGNGVDGTQGSTPNGSFIIETTAEKFAADVMEASMQLPVIVDFWAPWCEPCRQLTPVLEKIVSAANGAVRLVKLNIEDHPAIARQLQVQSIPAVFAFRNGRPVDGFMGALPESQVRQFISKLAGGDVGPTPAEALIEAAGAALQQEDLAAAAQAYGQALQQEPENPAAIGGLAQCYLAMGDNEGARKTLDMAPEALASHPDIAAARAAAALAEKSGDLGESSALEARIADNPDDFGARHDIALILGGAGRKEEAAQHLLHIIERNRNWNDEAARKQLLEFFDAWGPTDPATVDGRRKLSSILFS
ncbi:MAG: thioredoxin [Parvularculales bacterium]